MDRLHDGTQPDARAARPPELDGARVLATRTALREGRYRVDARRIAAAFLRIELPHAHPRA